jgi:DNA gyrase/topoisomerase IV subunit B
VGVGECGGVCKRLGAGALSTALKSTRQRLAPHPMQAVPVSKETSTLVRALVLYAVAEAQAGHAKHLQVTANGDRFTVADDGRGHAIDKVVDETPYLSYIYEHFKVPFDGAPPGQVQLQGIGMSLVNRLCSELRVTVRRGNIQLELVFQAGALVSKSRTAWTMNGTGTEVSGNADRAEGATQAVGDALRTWLQSLAAGLPGLWISYNGHLLTLDPAAA